MKNSSFKERIVSELMICEDCNCTERKRNAIKVDEPVYLKQHLMDSDLSEKYKLSKNKIYINTSYGEIEDFSSTKSKFCKEWILTDFGNRTKGLNVKECSKICYKEGTSLL